MSTIKVRKQKKIKCVVWDLDNTLWNGVLAEGDTLILKDNIVDILKELDRRGILQSISSRNNYDEAMLRLKKFKIDEFFLYPQINWNFKSESLGRLKMHLNLNLDTFAFIDDDRFELEEVKSVHPNVLCITSEKYQNILDLPVFNHKFVTPETSRRRLMYIDDIKRGELEKNYNGSKSDFLKSLNMEFRISSAKKNDLERVSELLARTNQLNSTGIVYSYEQLLTFATTKNYKLLICELEDNLGSYGKIGIALIEETEQIFHLRLLLMSCRVLSRGAGTVLLSYIMKITKESNKRLLADFKPTPYNKMMDVAYKFANFRQIGQDEQGRLLLENNLTHLQNYPPYMKIVIEE